MSSGGYYYKVMFRKLIIYMCLCLVVNCYVYVYMRKFIYDNKNFNKGSLKEFCKILRIVILILVYLFFV